MSIPISDDLTSYVVKFSPNDTHGLASNYTLRRHKFEAEANAGCHEARSDWIKYIGPIEEFGGCNPINGNFTAVVLPLSKPERLRLIAYVLEYAFLYDNMVELEKPDSSNPSRHDKQEWKNTNPALGKTQIQAKMMTQLESTDKACTERIKYVWHEMLSTTLRDKDKQFASLEEYVDFRIIDTGAPFVEAVLLFGMGMTLTKEEDAELAPIRKPCYAALGLANDYFSFDREYAEFQDSGKSQTLTNSVWLHMKWHNVDSIVAKEMTRKATRRYEKQFLEMCNEYRRRKAPLSEKLDRYLRALAYQVSGNVVWSLNCPRYHPEFRYDPNAGIEDSLTAEALPKAFQIEYDARLVEEVRDSAGINSSNGFSSDSGHSRRSSTDSSTTVSDDGDSSIRGGPSTSSSVSAYASTSEPKDSNPLDNEDSLLLDTRHVQAPYDYITSLPSKGVRDVFIDALNIWLDVPESIVSHIKSLGRRLHSASLMLDDIEDNSSLRRGQPATHTVFGVAQTINSGCYEILQAVGEARELGTASLDIVLEELAELHVGQSYDLHWTRHGTCPSEDEYLEMVAKKTGGLFRLLARLMFANRADSSPSDHPSDRHLHNDIKNLVELIGTQFQIRDDYQNLQSAEYSAQKGFCEDLDEGKYSFPLIHALACHPNVIRLRELLKRRQDAGSLSGEHKRLVLKELETAGSMEYTEKTLKRLQGQIYADVEKIEKSVGRENWILRALLQKLEV